MVILLLPKLANRARSKIRNFAGAFRTYTYMDRVGRRGPLVLYGSESAIMRLESALQSLENFSEGIYFAVIENVFGNG